MAVNKKNVADNGLNNKSINSENTKKLEQQTFFQATSLNSKENLSKASVEENIALKWFARIGIFSLVMGIGYFIKYAFDIKLLTHSGLIIVGTIFGVLLSFFGQILSKKDNYKILGMTLIGGGFAICYFAIYASYHFITYRIATGMTLGLNIILLSLIVLIAILISLKNNSQIHVGEAFILGFITTLLSGQFVTLTLIYSLMLSIAVVLVVIYKKWFYIGRGGIISSYIVYYIWFIQNYNYLNLITASFFLIGGYLIYLIHILVIKSTFEDKESIEHYSVLITIINSVLVYIFLNLLINKFFSVRNNFAYLAAILFVLYIGLYFFIKSLNKEKQAIAYLCFSIFYFTMFLLIKISARWLTIFLALELLLLSILYFRYNVNCLKISTYVLSIFIVLKILYLDLRGFGPSFLYDIYLYFVSFVFYVIYLCSFNLKEKQDFYSQTYFYSATALLILTIFSKFSTFWITIILSILTLIFATLYYFKNYNHYLYTTYILAGITTFKLLVIDSWHPKVVSVNFLINGRFILFLFSAAILYIIAFIANIKEKRTGDLKFRKYLFTWPATLLLFLIIILEFSSVITKGFFISIVLVLFAILLLALGFIYKDKQLRMQGLITFGISILKVFLYDTWGLLPIYKTFAYVILGSILLTVSFLYSKYKDEIKKFI
ncbi:MAG: DUF2339 domain-containing protein [Candidatus ainarchaeum sp.]|jgi:uncharacterized membrane protein|nr:DUF2339 domain-containing protein [Candidatus ainarchaeum sp.]